MDAHFREYLAAIAGMADVYGESGDDCPTEFHAGRCCIGRAENGKRCRFNGRLRAGLNRVAPPSRGLPIHTGSAGPGRGPETHSDRRRHDERCRQS